MANFRYVANFRILTLPTRTEYWQRIWKIKYFSIKQLVITIIRELINKLMKLNTQIIDQVRLLGGCTVLATPTILKQKYLSKPIFSIKSEISLNLTDFYSRRSIIDKNKFITLLFYQENLLRTGLSKYNYAKTLCVVFNICQRKVSALVKLSIRLVNKYIINTHPRLPIKQTNTLKHNSTILAVIDSLAAPVPLNNRSNRPRQMVVNKYCAFYTVNSFNTRTSKLSTGFGSKCG